MMKRVSLYLILILTGFFSLIGYSQNLTFTKIGEWGSGMYGDVSIQGSFAFCLADKGGLDIIDISVPSHPKKIAGYTFPGYAYKISVNNGYAVVLEYSGLLVIDVSIPSNPIQIGFYDFHVWSPRDVYLNGKYAYVICDIGLQIIDLSVPSRPFLVGSCPFPGSDYGYDIYVQGRYAYAANWDGLLIIDISNPRSPHPVKSHKIEGVTAVHVTGDYAYIAVVNVGIPVNGGLHIIDISNPAAPVHTGHYYFPYHSLGNSLDINGQYAYVPVYNKGLYIFNISNPSSPDLVGIVDTLKWSYTVKCLGNYAYVVDWTNGLQVIDISTPSSPTPLGEYDVSGNLNDMFIHRNYAYGVGTGNGLQIIDISNPALPVRAGNLDLSGWLKGVHVKGNYCYVVSDEELNIIDVSIPARPKLSGQLESGAGYGVFVIDSYAYVARGDSMAIIDISNPTAPKVAGNFSGSEYNYIEDVFVCEPYAYLACHNYGLKVVDVSNPESPSLVGQIYHYHTNGIYIKGNYAFVAAYGLSIIDISDPSSPKNIGGYHLPVDSYGVYVTGKYAYVACGELGLLALDISDPSAPILSGIHDTPGYPVAPYARDNYVYTVDWPCGRLYIFHVKQSSEAPQISLNRSQFNFAVNSTGYSTESQSLVISNSGGGNLNWNITTDRDWLMGFPSSAATGGKCFISVDSNGLPVGTHVGNLTVSSPLASNSPQVAAVTLIVYPSNQSGKPFGEFSTPIDGSLVSGSVPFTGWSLDDVGVQWVRLFREERNLLVYIGDAVFVEGARPDIAAAYPGYPNNSKAGWGYMMLTNFLPNGGNGTFNIHAIAADIEGNQVTLGIKTLICDNANAVKPFGTIDTPPQGGTASGSNYVNFGWALTPLPNTIPLDGSTIQVWVDGVPLGSPIYNRYRGDVAALFPGYNNSNGAAGYFYLDTTTYENGVHTISWSVKDDAGNEDGIGSRYFTIQNSSADNKQWTVDSKSIKKKPGDFSRISVDYLDPIEIKTGYNLNKESKILYPDEKGIIHIQIKELQRLEIHFYDSTLNLSPLPIGSFLDWERGIFYWQPGPGFVGNYRLVFIETDQNGNKTRKDVRVTIVTKLPNYP